MFRTRTRYERLITDLQCEQRDIIRRVIPFDGGEISVLFIKQLTDISDLMYGVIKPIISYCTQEKSKMRAKVLMNSVLYAVECCLESEDERVLVNILEGKTVLLFSTEKDYVVADFKRVEHRNIPTPETTYALRGPKDSFTENLDVNLSLIRYRVKDARLRIAMVKVGRRTKTDVAVIYIEDVANDTVVTEVLNRLNAIDVDGISESGELQALLLNQKFNLFPQIGILERSDMAYHTTLEGKVLILTDGSPFALVAPRVFSEFLHSCDDRYDNKYFGVLMRLIRYAALLILFTGSSLYVAIVSYNTGVLPSEYAILLAELRSKVPFSALAGAMIIEFVMEMLREALLRVPRQIGPAVGIVGTIIIGQAAMSSGLFSPLLLIISSVSLLASFAVPDYTIINPFRILKFGLILATGLFGLYGFVLFACLVLINLVSVNSFGVPYLAPFAPFNLYDFLRNLMASSSLSKFRPKYLQDKNQIRMKSKQPY